MKNIKCLVAVLVAAIVANVLDFLVQGMLLTHAFYSKIEGAKQDTAPKWFIFGDFVAVFVLAWVIRRTEAAFGYGAKGGATAGFYLGVLASFPTYHFIFLTTKGYPYALAWINTFYGIGWYVLIGAIIGGLRTKPAVAAAPAH